MKKTSKSHVHLIEATNQLREAAARLTQACKEVDVAKKAFREAQENVRVWKNNVASTKLDSDMNDLLVDE